ncbi:MAG: hypothetical protein LIQ31_10275 [Planctomycetes bacterium]|nr:hypothetical protein [Planctomycetota bacterium]
MENVHTLVLRSVYRDSAFLMRLSSSAREASGADQVSALMGTPGNKDLLAASGLLTAAAAEAGPNDLVVSIVAAPDRLAAARKAVEERLTPTAATATPLARQQAKSLGQALRVQPGTNLAIISTAGDYAKFEAAQALAAGLDVLLYSDNIAVPDEVALKGLAREKGRLLMGPDCGTALFQGVPLGFANNVRRGTVGLVASSGTGIQEVSCLLDRCGLGISYAYGTGRRDFFDAVGGVTAAAALERLRDDDDTKAILVIAQAPGEETRRRMAEVYKTLGKPVLTRYIGVDDARLRNSDRDGVQHVGTLLDLVLGAVRLLAPALDTGDLFLPNAPPPAPRRGFLRGVFSGGTLCQEAAQEALPRLRRDVYSNVPIPGTKPLPARAASVSHTFVDMGGDEFTVGHPHPMLFPEEKMERITAELYDPDTAVVLTDLVLGYGTCREQAKLLVRALDKASSMTGGRCRDCLVVASVTGTDADTPSRSEEMAILREAGVVVLGNTVMAARHAAQALAGVVDG